MWIHVYTREPVWCNNKNIFCTITAHNAEYNEYIMINNGDFIYQINNNWMLQHEKKRKHLFYCICSTTDFSENNFSPGA